MATNQEWDEFGNKILDVVKEFTLVKRGDEYTTAVVGLAVMITTARRMGMPAETVLDWTYSILENPLTIMEGTMQ